MMQYIKLADSFYISLVEKTTINESRFNFCLYWQTLIYFFANFFSADISLVVTHFEICCQICNGCYFYDWCSTSKCSLINFLISRFGNKYVVSNEICLKHVSQLWDFWALKKFQALICLSQLKAFITTIM